MTLTRRPGTGAHLDKKGNRSRGYLIYTVRVAPLAGEGGKSRSRDSWSKSRTMDGFSQTLIEIAPALVGVAGPLNEARV